MAFQSLRSAFGVLAGTAVLGLFPPCASAQYRSQAPPTTAQPRANTVSSTQVTAPPSGYVPPQAYPGYYPGYGPVQYNGRAGGYLSGASDVINAQGNFMVQREQKEQMRQQTEQAKIETRRMTVDNWLYERDVLPTAEEERERARMQQYQRSRNNPPLPEIWSGKALNDLLVALQKALGVPGPTVPLDAAMLRHINVTSGAAGNYGVGLLKDGGRLTWPVALQAPAYETERKKLEQLLPQAVQQGGVGPVPAETLNSLNAAIDGLSAKLKQNISRIDANQYMRAKRYLSELADSIKVLQDPNTANYVSGRWSANAHNVGELVVQMSTQGLRFAPATAGDQEAYTALHRAMVFYDDGVSRMTARPAGTP